jgi:hypothetical protein
MSSNAFTFKKKEWMLTLILIILTLGFLGLSVGLFVAGLEQYISALSLLGIVVLIVTFAIHRKNTETTPQELAMTWIRCISVLTCLFLIIILGFGIYSGTLSWATSIAVTILLYAAFTTMGVIGLTYFMNGEKAINELIAFLFIALIVVTISLFLPQAPSSSATNSQVISFINSIIAGIAFLYGCQGLRKFFGWDHHVLASFAFFGILASILSVVSQFLLSTGKSLETNTLAMLGAGLTYFVYFFLLGLGLYIYDTFVATKPAQNK